MLLALMVHFDCLAAADITKLKGKTFEKVVQKNILALSFLVILIWFGCEKFFPLFVPLKTNTFLNRILQIF